MRNQAFFLLIFVASFQGFPQDFLQYRIFGINEGLSQSTVNTIYADQEGKLWIGTQNGLNLFDGYHFQHFKNLQLDTLFLSDSYISSIQEDDQKILWIGTRQGITLLNQPNLTVKYLNNQTGVGIPENWIRGIIKGRSVMFALTDHFIITVSPDKKIPIIKRWRNQTSNVKLDYGTASLGDTLFFFNENTLYRFYQRKLDSVKVIISNNQPIVHLAALSNNRIACLFQNHFLILDQKLQIIEKQPLQDLGIKLQYNGQHLYILTRKGIFQYENNRISPMGNFPKPVVNLLSVGVRSFLVDKSNNAWIGTTGNGIIEINLKPPKIRAIIPSEIMPEQISNNQIRAILPFNSDLLLGIGGTGIVKLGTTNKIIEFNEPLIYTLVPFETFILSFGTQGVKLFDSNYRPASLEKEFPYLAKTIGNQVLSTYSYKKIGESYYVGTQNGLLIIEPKKQKAWFEEKVDELISSHLKYIFTIESCDDLLLLGTITGIIRYNLSSRSLSIVDLTKTALHSFSNNTIYQLAIDKNRRLWVGTVSGLFRIDSIRSPNPIPYRIPVLTNNVIYAVVADSLNQIWVGTERGLFRLTPTGEIQYSFSLNHGLPHLEFNLGPRVTMPNGEIYLGTQGGVAIINPYKMPVDTFNPNLYISSIEFIEPNITRILSLPQNRELEISPNVKNLRISFSSLDYTYPEHNQYRYRIDNNEWILLGNQNYLSFLTFRPGKYTLTINGTNSDNWWSNKQISLQLVVLPLWYSSLWAYLTYIAAGLLLLWIMVNLRMQKLRKINQILHEKEKVARQVAQQNDTLAYLHRNMTDSIRYAQRIQRALFPNEYQIKKYFPESFIFFQPKDIVSGDFYWLHDLGDNRVAIAAVDCTGHGVPGALMSVIGIKLLQEIIIQNKIQDPGEILQNLDFQVMELFKHHHEEYFLAEGMDLTFCIFDFNRKIVEFAGAINPLLRVRNGVLEEFKADKMPVGISKYLLGYPFQTKQIEFLKNDIFYLFTDGYHDQFGGPTLGKYRNSRFKEFLSTLPGFNMDMQQAMLENNFHRWKGTNEQVDDVLIIGIKV